MAGTLKREKTVMGMKSLQKFYSLSGIVVGNVHFKMNMESNLSA